MIPEPYYINLGRGLQAVHRFFLGNGDKNVSRETYQLTIDNGQLTICSGTGNVSLGRAEKIKQCGPPGADRGISLLWDVYTEVCKDRRPKKFAGDRSADCMRTGLTNRDSLVGLTCGHLMRTPAIKLPVPCEAGEFRP